MSEREPFNRFSEESENTSFVPKYWTVLYHGTNVHKPEWQGDNLKALDQEELEVGGRGFSVITREDQERVTKERQDMISRGITAVDSNTTKVYADASRYAGGALELQILFPNFHRRTTLQQEAGQYYTSKYGPERTQQVMDLADTVFWKNHQAGRHPLVPNKMRLTKVAESMAAEKRTVVYVPTDLLDIYQAEVE